MMPVGMPGTFSRNLLYNTMNSLDISGLFFCPHTLWNIV